MKYLCTLICAMLLITEANATIRRVGFTDFPPIVGTDYVSFYQAHQAAGNGDTIYVYPGKTISGSEWPNQGRAEIRKRLIIIAKGSWLDSTSTPKGNFGLQATKGIATSGQPRGEWWAGIFFQTGSEGSVIMGFNINGYIVPEVNNITIKGNFNVTIFLVDGNISNLTVEKNYRVAFTGSDKNTVTWSNLTIKNNFIYQLYLPDHSYTGTISNNTFAYDQTGAANGGELSLSYYQGNSGNAYLSYIWLRNGTWLFEDNLMVWYSNSNAANNVNYFIINGAEGSTLNNNVALQSNNFTQWPGNGTGNIFISPSQVADIFEAFPAIGNSSADSRYRLKANSPAKAGSTLRPLATDDAGMYGGKNPYKLSTIPSIPTIYSIGSPTGNKATGTSVEIKISTRSNN